MSKEFQAAAFMNSLPGSWKSTSEIIESVNGELGLIELLGLLNLHGDLKDRSIKEVESGKKQQGPRGRNRRFRGNCYSCGRRGHCQSDCPDKVWKCPHPPLLES